ncbi:MAG: flagellar protein FlgN [Burkholderiaceae bacterium]|nr:flagellar protein FlgN [Burkholderiaceae bacterium]
MKLASSSLPALHQCVQDELIAMTSFAKILKLEQAALIAGDTDQLESITPEKNILIKQLTELEKIRKSTLINGGYESNINGTERYLAQCEESDQVSMIWHQLLDISKEAKEFNRTNGILINRHISRNQSALNILQRSDPAANLYGPNGQSTNKSVTGRGFSAG